MKAYLLGIAGAVLLSALVSVVAPSGKMGKFVKGGMKIVVLVVLVAPFVNFFYKGDWGFLQSDTAIVLDTSYLAACKEKASGDDKAAIEAFISEEYKVGGEVAVSYAEGEILARKKISVKINDFGIIDEDERIDIMKKIKADLEKQYGCATEVS